MKYDRPGQFPTWRALLNEIICNLLGCAWQPGTRVSVATGLPIHYRTKSCRRCRRTIDVRP